MKKIIWMGSSLKDLQDCPEGVKDDVGFALYEAQQGEMPNKSKPLKGLLGVIEIKTDFRRDTYRTFIRLNLVKVYMFCMFSRRNLIMENQLQNLICR